MADPISELPVFGLDNDELKRQVFGGRWNKQAVPGPYVTQLNAQEEPRFQQWMSTQGVQNTPDYDMQGFWKAQQAGDPNAVRSENLHYPDTYKTPYHETFSNESQYALPTAGHWDGEKFIPPQLGQRRGLRRR